MLTASASNTNLTIFSPSNITGVNTSLLFVFDNNVFRSISTYVTAGSILNLTLAKSVFPDSAVKVNLYSGGITTASGAFGTSVINVTNSTIFEDNAAPSFYEIVESGNYNFTSYVFSNYITGITTEANFPTASLTLKRRPPIGKITINEGFLGPMKVHRFVGLSSSTFSNPEGDSFESAKYLAFDYIAYGEQIVNSIQLGVSYVSGSFPTNSKCYLSINQDYFGSPSQVSLGISTILTLSGSGSQTADFTFSPSITLSEGTYWIIFTPTVDSSFALGKQIVVNSSTSGNYYSQNVLESEDGAVFTDLNENGVSFTINTQRGIPLPSIDAVYNQLDQPQDIEIQYGDQANLNIYTELAVPTTSHYIQKNFIDQDSEIVAVEVLVDSSGQNQYQVLGISTTVPEEYFNMIANSLTTNIVRYDLTEAQTLNALRLNSLGDYYAKGTQGTVLVSATDFMGISTVEISTSPLFPESGTTIVNLADEPQQYIANLDFNFGDVGKKFNVLQSKTGASIIGIFLVTVNSVVKYLLITDSKLYLYYDGSVELIFTLSNSIFTSFSLGTNGIVLGDSLQNVYNYANGAVTTVGSVSYIPTALATQLNTTYIGISTLADSSSAQSRRRIFSLINGSINHLTWSTQIPESQITFIYPTSFGLIIGAYDQNNLVGKVYIYYNSLLTLFYTGKLRPDAALYSTSTNRLYVVFAGSSLLYATYTSSLQPFVDSGVPLAGSKAKQIALTKITDKILVITNLSAYIFDELTFATSEVTKPTYSSTDQTGMLVQVQTNDLNIINYPSTYVNQSFSNINFDPLLNGFNSSFVYSANGYIVFTGLPVGIATTSMYLQYPDTATLESITLDGQNISLEENAFTQNFVDSVPKEFSFTLRATSVSGIGTIALRNGLTSTSPIVGIASFVAPKNLNYYYRTGSTNDIFGFSDGSLRNGNITELSSNKYEVYARFTDINGIYSDENYLASDVIYNQVQQQSNNQALPSGRIIEINPASPNNVNQYVPPLGTSDFIYSGTKIVRSNGIFESDPYYASDVVSWNQIQVLAYIPGSSPTGGDYGTSVTLFVKTGDSLIDLNNTTYINSYSVSTINNGNDYSVQIASILANIASLSGKWIQFKLVLTSATQNLTPAVQSVLLTYTGAGRSVFVTKSFDTSIQSSINPTPKIRRGILTANFVTNGGEIVFGYTTDPNDGNPLNYTVITPNQIFTLPTPSSIIKFGVILKTATSNPCFFDEFAVQLDLGPDDVYFMPPLASFEIQQYVNDLGVAVTHAYQFVNKTIGIVSAYNWSFGTSYPGGITTYYPPNEDPALGPAANRQNPIIGFANSGPFTVGLFVTGFVQNNVVFNSDLFTKTFIAT
jgi:hypothetical protein